MVDQDNNERLVSSDEWHWYGKSKLDFWLRHDTWSTELGLCLICNIDPEKSEDLNIDDIVDGVDIMPGDKFSHRVFERVCLLSEDPIYKLEPAKNPDDWAFHRAKKHLEDITSWLNEDDIDPKYIKPSFNDICDRLRFRQAACERHNECWSLFESNPAHLAQETFAPTYFVGWAASKGIETPWLDWAKHNGYVLDDPKTARRKSRETQAVSVKKTPSTKAPERDEEKMQEIVELRMAANKRAVKLKIDGMPATRITVARICEDLLKEKFSSGKPFTSRRRKIDGMRSYLKGEYHPQNTEEFRKAKSERAKFNP